MSCWLRPSEGDGVSPGCRRPSTPAINFSCSSRNRHRFEQSLQRPGGVDVKEYGITLVRRVRGGVDSWTDDYGRKWSRTSSEIVNPSRFRGEFFATLSPHSSVPKWIE